MKIYRGYRLMHQDWQGMPTTAKCTVMVHVGKHKRKLRPRLDIRSHSPDGFEWGYGGSGPAQLALALVADCCGDEMARPEIYQRVKRLVASLPHDGWTLTEEQVREAVAAAQAEAGGRP